MYCIFYAFKITPQFLFRILVLGYTHCIRLLLPRQPLNSYSFIRIQKLANFWEIKKKSYVLDIPRVNKHMPVINSDSTWIIFLAYTYRETVVHKTYQHKWYWSQSSTHSYITCSDQLTHWASQHYICWVILWAVYNISTFNNVTVMDCFWKNEFIIFLSFRVFRILSSSILLFPQHFGWYVLEPSSGVCQNQEPTWNYLLYWIHGSCLFWFC